jgi:predicted nucleotidyltransferase
MDLGSPYSDVLTGARGRVLAALVQAAEPVTVRQLALRASASPQGALDVVDDLTDAGVVLMKAAGRSHMVSLNRDHLATAPIEALVTMRVRLIEALRIQLEGWHTLHAAWLFGSAARGDGSRASDIDILVVGDDLDDPSWDEQIGHLYTDVLGWTGNEPEVLEYDRADFARLVDERPPFIRSIESDGIPLTDRTTRRLLRAA